MVLHFFCGELVGMVSKNKDTPEFFSPFEIQKLFQMDNQWQKKKITRSFLLPQVGLKPTIPQYEAGMLHLSEHYPPPPQNKIK